MFKKIFKMSCLVYLFIFTITSTNVFANTIEIDPDNIVTRIYTSNEATLDRGIRMPRSNRVTESEVSLYSRGSKYFKASGYVTVKDGNIDVNHYSRAEVHVYGNTYISASNKWGFGYVPSTTPETLIDPWAIQSTTARIFYGW